MNTKLAFIPILALVISLSTVSLANAESDNTTGTTSAAAGPTTAQTDAQSMPGQTGASCAQSDIDAAKQEIADIQKKMADLKAQYYNDWQAEHNSGQYNGTWEQYSREKISSSSDLSQIRSDYQKYSSILRSCGIAQMHPNYSSTTCNPDDITHARKELATTMQQGTELKDKIYQQFQQDKASGQFNGTWAQYAQEKFYNLPELVQLKSTHEKYASFMKGCFARPSQSQGTQNQDGNSMPPPTRPDFSSTPSDSLYQGAIGSDLGLTSSSNTVAPIYQSQNLAPISNSADAQGLISSSHGLPAWVKGIAGWWAEGKISDGDFVNAIQFLVHQGIIKV